MHVKKLILMGTYKYTKQLFQLEQVSYTYYIGF